MDVVPLTRKPAESRACSDDEFDSYVIEEAAPIVQKRKKGEDGGGADSKRATSGEDPVKREAEEKCVKKPRLSLPLPGDDYVCTMTDDDDDFVGYGVSVRFPSCSLTVVAARCFC